MIGTSVMLMVFAVYAVHVECQNDIGFPDGAEGSDDGLGNRQGFRPQQGSRPQQGFRPRPGDNFRPPSNSFGPPPPGFNGNNNFGSSNIPGNGFPSGSGSGFRPQGSQGNTFGSSGVRPGNDRPNSRPGSNSNPTNSRPVNNLRPNSNSPNGNGLSDSEGGNFQNSQPGGSTRRPSTSSSTTSSTASSGETTTRIPPRDPTNRIVYVVSCPCQFTRQYAPVCGTDGQTYGNMGVLQCAQQCGTDVRVFLMGACGRNNG